MSYAANSFRNRVGLLSKGFIAAFVGTLLLQPSLGQAQKLLVPTFTQKPQLMFDIGDFWAAGTVYIDSKGRIVFGDYLGADGSDADGDGNVEQVWDTGSPIGGADVDFGFSKKGFNSPNVRLTFDACIAPTYVSYQWIALFFSRPQFAGTPGTYSSSLPYTAYDIGFMTRWENPSTVHVSGYGADTFPIPLSVGLVNGPEGFCGSYELRRQNGKVKAFVNKTLVFEAPARVGTGPIAISVRSWDSPIKISKLKWKAIKGEKSVQGGKEGDEDTEELNDE